MTETMHAPANDFSSVSAWVFDLDNTLYPRTCQLFAQIDVLITKYVMAVTGLAHDPAKRLQKDWYRDYGTTLNGLMHLHGTDPTDYLRTVHDIDYASVAPDPALTRSLKALPGKKYVFTNADSGHAKAVLDRLGGGDVFDGVFDIQSSDYTPKPHAAAYEAFFTAFDIAPQQAAMFEDLEKNLLVPHQRGMKTVHVVPEAGFTHANVEHWELSRADAHPHVHYVTNDLGDFLKNAIQLP